MPTDLELVARYRDQHDQAAFTELVRRHRDAVFRLAASILGQAFTAEAEEVAQETFLAAHKGLARFRGDAQFGSWLYRIAFHQAVNRKARVRFRAPHLSEDALAATASAEPGPHDQLEAARREQAVAECIDRLPPVYQSALRLHYWMGTGLAEIAELLDVPENTVKSHLHRSRKLLHAMLEERGYSNG